MKEAKICCICKNEITGSAYDICDQGWICKTCKDNCPENCLPCPVEMRELELHGEEF